MRRLLVLAFATAVTGCGSSAEPGPSSQRWTGIGAKVSDWESAHPKNTTECPAGTCYGYRVKSEGSEVDEFKVLTTTPDGRVDGFEYAFPDGTSIATAKADLHALLPSDTTTTLYKVAHTSTGSCVFWNVRSATLARWFAAPKVGDPEGTLGISLATLASSNKWEYNPHNVTEAQVSLATATKEINC